MSVKFCDINDSLICIHAGRFCRELLVDIFYDAIHFVLNYKGLSSSARRDAVYPLNTGT